MTDYPSDHPVHKARRMSRGRREPLKFLVFEPTCTPEWEHAYEVFSRHSSLEAARAAARRLALHHTMKGRIVKVGELYTGSNIPKAGAIHRYGPHAFYHEETMLSNVTNPRT